MYEIFCMNTRHPVGISADRFTFSWKIRGCTPSVRQSACRLIIEDANRLPIYDSGKLMTSEPRLSIPADSFKPSREYFCKIQCWDENGHSLGLSPAEWLVTGTMSEDFPAPFISASGKDCDLFNDTLLYECEFDLDKAYSFGIVHAASIGQHILFVNGIQADARAMAPSRSKIQKDSPRMSDEHEGELTRVRCVSYDVSALLRPGKNTLSCWTDAGWARSSHTEPALAVQGVFRSGKDTRIVQTDDVHWRCARMPVRHINGFHWSDFGGEEIHTDTFGNRLNAEKRAWLPVRIVPCESLVTPDMHCADAVLRTLQPAKITEKDGAYIVDMGEPFTGWLSFEIERGTVGQTVTLSASDKATEEISFQQKSDFILDSLPARCCNRFNFMCGQYFCIRGAECAPKNVQGLVIGNRMDSAFRFHSSNDLLNRIVEADLKTFTANTINGVVCDCPHRERLGYGETGISTTWGIGLQAFDYREFFGQFLENWADRQRASGYLPHVAPNSDGGGGTTWSSCLLITLHDFFAYSKDRELIRKLFPVVNQWINYLLNYTSAGLFEKNADDRRGFSFLGDWACSEGNDWGFTPNALFFNNCVCLYNLKIAREMAEIAADESNLNMYRLAYDCMRKAIHQRYYDRTNHCYMNGEQRYQAVALCAGVPSDEDRPDVIQTFRRCLEQKRYLDGGSAGIVFILRAALETLPDPQFMYEILCRTEFPGYGYFIRQGCQTWPEMWSISEEYGGSRVHTCYTGITGYIVRGIAGLMPDETLGAQRMHLKPFFPADQSHMEIQVDYGFGELAFRWEKSTSNALSCRIDVPFNEEVVLHLPEGYAAEGETFREKTFLSGTHLLTLIHP